MQKIALPVDAEGSMEKVEDDDFLRREPLREPHENSRIFGGRGTVTRDAQYDSAEHRRYTQPLHAQL